MSTSKKQPQASFSGKLPPKKRKNADVRPREYLTDKEVAKLMKAASKVGRHRHRDSTLILVTYRHGFRVSELVALGWNQVELDGGRLHVSRAKDGTHQFTQFVGRKSERDYPDSPYVFVTERKGPLTDSAVRKMIARAGKNAGFDFSVHPHMLRHATGYKLANDGRASHPAISRPQEHPAHRSLHGACFNAFSRLLEGLETDMGRR